MALVSVNTKYKIKSVEVEVKRERRADSVTTGRVYKDNVVTVRAIETGWVLIENGWIALAHLGEISNDKPNPPATTPSAPIAINQRYEVISDNLVIRKGSSVSHPSVGTLKKDTIITGSKLQAGWVYMGQGWVSSIYLKAVPDSEVIQTPTSPIKVKDVPIIGPQPYDGSPLPTMPIMDTSGGRYSDFNSTLEGEDGSFDINSADYGLFTATANTTSLKTIRGIHGMPYQFMSSADMKISEFDGVDFPYGRKFTEKIINRMPLLLLSPGKPMFLDGFSKSKKTSVLSNMVDMVNGGESELEKILGDNEHGRYYSFRFNYKDYYDYVNGMCMASSVYLGIADKTINGKSYRNYDWSQFANDGLKGFFSGSEYVCFYVDSDSQISESFSNSTGESMLDSGLNKLSDLAKEADFLLGAGVGVKIDALNEEKYEANMEEISKFIKDYSNPGHLVNKLKNGAVTIAGGGQLIFPEIWKDSSWSKSYDVNIKLTSPDGDTESIYRNILVPLWHLLGMALPLQMGHNGFRSPFLVKGFFKGLFHCEMGIITSLSIRKGGEGSWNIEGLPTEVEVSFTLKDLYEVLAITKWKDTKLFVNNTQMMDFIANMCGIVINKPEILRKAEMFASLNARKVLSLPANVKLGLSQTISNSLLKVLK